MYEELKQEIRDVVKPNFRQQINGQNLQDVLIDMVDNYPAVSGSEELNDLISKSGSWDNAADWVTNNSGSLVTSESLAPVIEDLKDEIAEMGDTYATTASVNTLSASFDERINNIITGSGVDLSGYATTASLNAATASVKEWVEDKHYLTEHQDISGLATTASVNSLSESVANDFANLDIPDISGLATTASVNSLSSSLHQDIQNVEGNLSEYATTASVNSLSESVANDFANLDIPDISGLATTSSVNSLSESVGTISASFDQRINAITGSGGGSGSALWLRSRFGGLSPDFEDNVVRPAVSGALNLGRLCNAGAYESIAEGYQTSTSASYSHTFGRLTSTTNDYEVAMGLYNDNQPGQLFSVGVGETIGECCKGNAISVINHGTASAYFEPSASVYILGVGSYKGYNPAPGVNDVATIISRLLKGETEGLWHPSVGVQAVRQTTGSVASGRYSLAEGNQTTASGDGAHAEGEQTQAGNWAAHAEGFITTASGQFSHAEGSHTKASGEAAHAEGFTVTASGQFSHAEGENSVASGYASHAEGQGAQATGFGSHAEGLGTITTNSGEHASGRFNVTSSDQIFSVGVGTYPTLQESSSRSNAISIIAPESTNTASVYIQGVGGYDGTNPVSGSNDLATILNNFETWTFVLEDSSSVTKSVLVR